MFAGQLIEQDTTALIVTVNVQEAELLSQSQAVQVTVVAPTANVEPDAGAQEVAPGAQRPCGFVGLAAHESGQLSVTVGLG